MESSSLTWNDEEVMKKMRRWHDGELKNKRGFLEKYYGSVESQFKNDPQGAARAFKLAEVDFGYRAAYFSRLGYDIFLLPTAASEKNNYSFNELVKEAKRYEDSITKRNTSLECFVSESLKELMDAGVVKKKGDNYYFWPKMTSALGEFKEILPMKLKKGAPNEAPDEAWNKVTEMQKAIHSFILNDSDPSLDELRKKGFL
jgi:hypothetical protein